MWSSKPDSRLPRPSSSTWPTTECALPFAEFVGQPCLRSHVTETVGHHGPLCPRQALICYICFAIDAEIPNLWNCRWGRYARCILSSSSRGDFMGLQGVYSNIATSTGEVPEEASACARAPCHRPWQLLQPERPGSHRPAKPSEIAVTQPNPGGQDIKHLT